MNKTSNPIPEEITKEESKRVEISKIGKMATIARLFENSDYTNNETIKLIKKDCSWVSSHKSILEGIDFDLVYTPLKHLGYKATLSAIGSIYAKGCKPYSVSIVLGLSKRFFYEDVENIWTGVLAAAKEHKIEKLALDLNPSITGLCINVAAQGYISAKDLKNKPKVINNDIICISGNIGAAYMGLHVLEREKASFVGTDSKQPDLSPYQFILSEYLSPQLKAELFQTLEKEGITTSSGYFITRGLASTIKLLADENNCGARIYLEKIPIASQTFKMAEEINVDPITAALNGGDDYKFLFTVPLNQYEKLAKEMPDLDIIGHLCEKEDGCNLITPDGNILELKAQGW